MFDLTYCLKYNSVVIVHLLLISYNALCLDLYCILCLIIWHEFAFLTHLHLGLKILLDRWQLGYLITLNLSIFINMSCIFFIHYGAIISSMSQHLTWHPLSAMASSHCDEPDIRQFRTLNGCLMDHASDFRETIVKIGLKASSMNTCKLQARCTLKVELGLISTKAPLCTTCKYLSRVTKKLKKWKKKKNSTRGKMRLHRYGDVEKS